MARQHGATDEELAAMEDPASGPFPEAEKAAFAFARSMTLDHRGIRDEDVAALREHWSEPEIVEMACVIGIFNYLNRFAEGLGLDPTRPGEGGPGEAGPDPGTGSAGRGGGS